MGTKSYARVRQEMRLTSPSNEEPSRAEVYIATHVRHDGKPLNEKVGCYIAKMKDMQMQRPTLSDDHGPNDIYSQVLGADKPRYSRTFGLGPMRGAKNSRMSILKQALEAKQSAEQEVEMVKLELGELRKQQADIIALLQQNNIDVNVNDVVPSPSQGDIDLNQNASSPVQEENNIGAGSFLAMLGTSDATLGTGSDADQGSNLLDIYLPMSRNLPKTKESSVATNNDPFLHYMLHSYQQNDSQTQTNYANMNEGGQNETNSSTQGLTYCVLKSLNHPDVDVAKGSIVSKRSNARVGDIELGHGFYEIFVDVAMKPDEPLVRPYESFQVIGDVVGRTTAWPAILVQRQYVASLF
ncbi:hypothetical protein LINPERHAP2_LOCUS29072 [Linum perenne]